MRLFVAVSPGAAVVERARQVVESLRPAARRAKWSRVENVHLTLAFLGEKDEALAPAIGDAVEEVARRHRPFTLRFEGGGAFGRPARPRVLWGGCAGDTPALAALQADVARALAPFGYVSDHPEFSAHLTLARSRDQGGDPDLARCVEMLRGVEIGEAPIHELTLFESRMAPGGSVYVAVRNAGLGGS